MRFVLYQDRKKIAANMRTIYTTPSLAGKPPEQRPDRSDRLPGPSRQGPRSWLPQQDKMIIIVYLTAAKLQPPPSPTPAYIFSR